MNFKYNTNYDYLKNNGCKISLEDYVSIKDNEGTTLSLYDYLSINKRVKELLNSQETTLDTFIEIFEGNLLLYHGTNDYRKFTAGNKVFIPKASNWGSGGVLGSGLYLTCYEETAIDYANGITMPLYVGGQGCSKNIQVLSISLGSDINEYKNCRGILLKPQHQYTPEEWNKYMQIIESTPNIYFIIGIEGNGTEIVFVKDNNKLIYQDISKHKSDNCSLPYNYSIGNVNENIKKLYPHVCLTDKNIKCPTSCEYLKQTQKLPVNIDNNNNKTQIICGTDNFEELIDEKNIQNGGNNQNYIKYLKYKKKYLELKKII